MLPKVPEKAQKLHFATPRGEISRRSQFGDEVRQRMLLDAEDVEFDWRGRVSLKRYGWRVRRTRG